MQLLVLGIDTNPRLPPPGPNICRFWGASKNGDHGQNKAMARANPRGDWAAICTHRNQAPKQPGLISKGINRRDGRVSHMSWLWAACCECRTCYMLAPPCHMRPVKVHVYSRHLHFVQYLHFMFWRCYRWCCVLYFGGFRVYNFKRAAQVPPSPNN